MRLPFLSSARTVLIGRFVATASGALLLSATASPAAAASRPVLPTPTATAIATTTTTTQLIKDIVWRQVDGKNLHLDAYLPNDGRVHPAVIMIHGGGWAGGSKQNFHLEGPQLAAAGMVAFSIDYRLAPSGGSWHSPDELDDVHAAVLWVRNNASAYNVDPARVGALGGSAGANLAMMLATTGTAGQDKVSVAVSWSAPTELSQLPNMGWVNKTWVACVPGQVCKTPYNTAANYTGCSYATCKKTWLAASPADNVTSQTSPILIVNSDAEIIPIGQATLMDTTLTTAKVPHQLVILAGKQHANAYSTQIMPQTISFLQTYLGT